MPEAYIAARLQQYSVTTEWDMDAGNYTILISDDQPDVREAMRLLLRSEGYAVSVAESPEQVLECVAGGSIDLALLDLNYTRDTTSGGEGLELIAQLQQVEKALPLVAMTAWGTVELAVNAMRQGAVDFIEKPWDNLRLLNIVRTQLERVEAVRRGQRYEEIARISSTAQAGHKMIALSDAMKRIVEMARQVAPSAASILITGENGTGKSLIAQQIHRWSSRCSGPLITLNMGSIPENLFESEMFGHVRGAFTDAREARPGRFELADKGTLFLDEIGNLPTLQQAKLLRVLETGSFERVGDSRTQQVDVRVIAATNAQLTTMVDAGAFRRDLFFRLNTIELKIPSLRQRQKDILPLALRFLERESQRYQKAGLTLSESARATLLKYSWPGNVRELAHVIERAVLLCAGSEIKEQDLGLGLADNPSGRVPEVGTGTGVVPLSELEQEMILRALNLHEGNIPLAADALGLSRSALYRRLEKYGIEF